MADFNQAVEIVLRLEGGFVDNPHDHGGATNKGITLKLFQSVKPNATIEDLKALSNDSAAAIYKSEFWDKGNYTEINSQAIANSLFKLAVNASVLEANKLLQRAMRAACGNILHDDGILGSESLRAINSANPLTVLIAFKAMADAYYRSLNQPEFLSGWLNRLYS